jgi:hypothetical protein
MRMIESGIIRALIDGALIPGLLEDALSAARPFLAWTNRHIVTEP